MNGPKVSIIVPAYNLEAYVGKCIESLTNQTYRNLEIILVDDGSTDGTWNVLEKYAGLDNRIIIKHQPNGRTARARNNGLESATGDFIMFVDGDDMLSPETIETNIKHLIADPELDWVSFSILRVDECGNIDDDNKCFDNFIVDADSVIEKPKFLQWFRERKISGLCCGNIYRAHTVKDIRFPVGEYYEDSFYFRSASCASRKGMLSSQGKYLYLIRDNSSQVQKLDRARLISRLHLAEMELSLFSEHFPDEDRILNDIKDDYYYFFKLNVSKNTNGAEEIFQDYCKIHPSPCSRRWRSEFKILVYRIVGYKNIRRVLDVVKKVDAVAQNCK